MPQIPVPGRQLAFTLVDVLKFLRRGVVGDLAAPVPRELAIGPAVARCHQRELNVILDGRNGNAPLLNGLTPPAPCRLTSW